MSAAPVISGVGQSKVGRGLEESAMALTLDACLRAIEDAGLDRSDIDGLVTYPGDIPVTAGFSGPGTADVQDALRLSLNFHVGGKEMSGPLGTLAVAVMAVRAGLSRHVLVYRTMTEAAAQEGRGRSSVQRPPGARVEGSWQWSFPFGAFSAANWLAPYAMRHFHEYGTTREHLAAIAINARNNAALYPAALFQDPLTRDEYFSARMVSEPLCMFDCDVPADGSTAFVVSVPEYAPDAPTFPVAVEAVGTAIRGRPSWDQWEDFTTMAAFDAGAHMWSMTDMSPEDVDVAELYDGFSFLTLFWLEALGFCGVGESGDFIGDGSTISLNGSLPLATSGGQLSAGRLHGYGLFVEACRQVRGEAGPRQVPDTASAVVAVGGGPNAACALLRSCDA